MISRLTRFKFVFQLFTRAKTQDLEEQQPGVEGELRRLINKPGKTQPPPKPPSSIALISLCFWRYLVHNTVTGTSYNIFDSVAQTESVNVCVFLSQSIWKALPKGTESLI